MKLLPGSPRPLGATWDIEGANFALFSAHATAVEVLQQHVNAPVPELPPELRRHQLLLEGMMAKQRDDRFATIDALLQHLSRAAA